MKLRDFPYIFIFLAIFSSYADSECASQECRSAEKERHTADLGREYFLETMELYDEFLKSLFASELLKEDLPSNSRIENYVKMEASIREVSERSTQISVANYYSGGGDYPQCSFSTIGADSGYIAKLLSNVIRCIEEECKDFNLYTNQEKIKRTFVRLNDSINKCVADMDLIEIGH